MCKPALGFVPMFVLSLGVSQLQSYGHYWSILVRVFELCPLPLQPRLLQNYFISRPKAVAVVTSNWNSGENLDL